MEVAEDGLRTAIVVDADDPTVQIFLGDLED
jgi:hypothetical protein